MINNAALIRPTSLTMTEENSSLKLRVAPAYTSMLLLLNVEMSLQSWPSSSFGLHAFLEMAPTLTRKIAVRRFALGAISCWPATQATRGGPTRAAAGHGVHR